MVVHVLCFMILFYFFPEIFHRLKCFVDAFCLFFSGQCNIRSNCVVPSLFPLCSVSNVHLTKSTQFKREEKTNKNIIKCTMKNHIPPLPAFKTIITKISIWKPDVVHSVIVCSQCQCVKARVCVCVCVCPAPRIQNIIQKFLQILHLSLFLQIEKYTIISMETTVTHSWQLSRASSQFHKNIHVLLSIQSYL